MIDIPKQLTVKEASMHFNIPQNTLRAYIHRRIIPFRKVRGRVYLVTETLEAWLKSFDVPQREQEPTDKD